MLAKVLKAIITDPSIVDVSFQAPFATTSTISADLHERGGLTKVATVGSAENGPRGGKVTISCDFTGQTAGDYYLKIFTSTEGVLAKALVTLQ